MNQQSLKYRPYRQVPKLNGVEVHNQHRKNYYRFRQIKNTTYRDKPKPITTNIRNSDFYSHQKQIIKKIQTKKEPPKYVNTTTGFFKRSIHSRSIRKIGSIEANPETSRSPTPKVAMRNTFYGQSSDTTKAESSSKSNLFGKTSVNFNRNKHNIYNDDIADYCFGKYEIINQLGKGTFSTVYLAKKRQQKKNNIGPQTLSTSKIDESQEQKLQIAKDQQTQANDRVEKDLIGQQSVDNSSQEEELVAVKVYEKFKMSKDPHKFKNIRKEINIMQNLDHQNILKLHHTSETLTKINLVMEYGGTSSLLQHLKQKYPLSTSDLRDISLQMLEGICFMHQKNMVHRDLKLQNILFKEGVIKIIDFGFSCLTHRGAKLNVICGTPNYMAPQILYKKEYIGEEVDMWSYGIILFALCEGRHPFKAENYNELARLTNKGKYEFKKTANKELIEVIRRCLRVNPSQRLGAKQLLSYKWFKQQQQ